MAFENEMKERRGRPKSNGEMSRNFDSFIGRTDEAAAKRCGFKCKDTYRQAKQVIEQGIPELICAMDTEFISISLAAKIAALPIDEQKEILQRSQSKKEIIAALKHLSQKNKNTNLSLNKTELDKFLLNSLQAYFYFSQHFT